MKPIERCRRPSCAAALLLLGVLGAASACSAYRAVGEGDVAFRLVWEGRSDLDLLVEDPSGECIFFGHHRSPTGGLLDIDCNGGADRMCARPVENVFWPVGTAPPGRYRLWVQAHFILPTEVPLAYRLQVLRGKRPLWRHEGTIHRHQELHGPFVYTAPEATMASPSGSTDLPGGCQGFRDGVPTPEAPSTGRRPQ